jgi:hypothetical protein
MGELTDHFIQAIQETGAVAPNHYLTFLSNAVKEVDTASPSDPCLSDYVKELSSLIIKTVNFALNAKETEKFAQILGEAHFYLLCKEKGVILERVTGGGYKEKKPDFKLKDHDVFFEVKTLSVVEGHQSINQSLNDSMESQIEIDEQFQNGFQIASSEMVVQPYGEKPYEKGKGALTTVIETILEKTRNNLRSGQFKNNNTFLVLNLSMLILLCHDTRALRPAYCDDYIFKKVMTGELWMIGFGQPGMAIFTAPEWEGKPCIESFFDKEGILVSQDYEDVAGLLFMIHPWRKESEIWGLFSYEKHNYWNDHNTDLLDILMVLTDKKWNDDKDTNGWQLEKMTEPFSIKESRA